MAKELYRKYRPTTFEDVVGNETAIKSLKKELKNGSHVFLMTGPAGCGKTTLAYSIGGEFQIPFYKITGPDIISSLSGESEQIIRNLL